MTSKQARQSLCTWCFLLMAAVLGTAFTSAFGLTFSDQVVPSTANIFGSGHPANLTPNPGGGSGGTPSIPFSLSPGSGRVLTFASVTGLTSLTAPHTTSLPDGLAPDGTAPLGLSTNINPYLGISGIVLDQGSGFLCGVFLSDDEPSGVAPDTLLFTNNGTGGEISTSFTELAPAVGQTFFIGDGLTGMGVGSVQRFLVPDDATRFFLGIADGYSYHGNPGQYQDNAGAFTASFSFAAADVSASVPEPITMASLGAGLVSMGVYLRSRRSLSLS